MPAGWTPERLGAMQELDRRGALSPVQSGALKEILRRQGGGAPSAVTGLQQTPTAQQQPESYGGALETAINSFADAATLGLSGKAQSYLAAKAAQAGLFGEGAKGQPFDKLYAAAEELRRQRDAGLSAENPYASAAGTVAGALGTGVVAGRTAARMGFKPAERIGGRLAQYAKGGAAVGAAEQIIDKGGVSGDTLAAAALGGAAGAAGGGLTEKLVPLLAPGMGRAWRKLAAQIRTPVEDIAAFVDDAIQKTGKVPSVAQVFHARDQGVLKGWAARHNTFGTSFDEAAMAARGQDISVGQLRRARTDAFEASIGPIRDTPVQVSKDLLGDTHVADALRGPKMKDIRIKINDGDPLTVGDVDRMRQKLRDMQKAEPGGPFGDYADQLRDDTAAQLPEYGAALDKYFKDSRYIEGFESGMAGKSLSEVSDKVQLPEGVAGHEAGAATRKGQRALSNMAPSSVASEADIPGASEMARGAGHIAVGGPALGTFHVGQSVRSALDHLPEKMQQELAAGLLSRDPAVVRATLGKMRKAGTSLKTIRQLATGMGLYSGASAVQGATTEHKPLEITVTHGATQ